MGSVSQELTSHTHPTIGSRIQCAVGCFLHTGRAASDEQTLPPAPPGGRSFPVSLKIFRLFAVPGLCSEIRVLCMSCNMSTSSYYFCLYEYSH